MNAIHFAQIREDSWVEHSVAQAACPQRSAVIASGGCTALSLLFDHTDRLIAIDASPAQCALVEVRKAAIRHLTRDQYLAFIGERMDSGRLQTWTKLAPDLPAYARNYWSAHPEWIAQGIQYAGTTERFYRFISGHLQGLLGPDALSELLQAPTISEQQRVYARHFAKEVTREVLRVLLSKSTHLLFFPAFMFGKAQEHDFSAFFIGQFEREVQSRPLLDNYFLSQLFFGRYLDNHARGLPPYLTPDGYACAKRNIDKLEVRVAPLHEALREERDLDAFFLSNVFDWCAGELMEATSAAVSCAARPGATLLYRNMLSESAIAHRFVRDDLRSKHLHEQDRSILYRNLSIGVFT